MPPKVLLTQIVQFDDFEVNFRTSELRRRGVLLHVQAKPLAVLAELLRCPNEVVSREDLNRALWPGETFVDYDKNLGVAVGKLRDVLRDSGGASRYIETVPRRGYRFVGAVKLYPEVAGAEATVEQQAEVPAVEIDQPAGDPVADIAPTGGSEGAGVGWPWRTYRVWGIALVVVVVSAGLYLFPRLKAGTSMPRPVNPEAQQDYQKAKNFSDRWILQDVKSALIFDNRAIAIEPTYAEAFSLRAALLLRMGEMGAMDNEEACKEGRADALHAINLNPNLTSGYVALAGIQMNHDWDLAGAEVSLAKARQLSPNDLSTLSSLASLSRMSGRMEESISLQRQVIALDPFKGSQYGSLAVRLYAVGRLDEALTAHQRALELDPQLEYVHLNRAEIFLFKGLPTEALKEVEMEPGEVWQMFGKVLVLHDLGRRAESDSALTQLMAAHATEPYVIACAYAYRGELDEAFTWLDRAVKSHNVSPAEIRTDPMLRKLYPDSRFAALLRKMGLPR